MLISYKTKGVHVFSKVSGRLSFSSPFRSQSCQKYCICPNYYYYFLSVPIIYFGSKVLAKNETYLCLDYSGIMQLKDCLERKRNENFEESVEKHLACMLDYLFVNFFLISFQTKQESLVRLLILGILVFVIGGERNRVMIRK